MSNKRGPDCELQNVEIPVSRASEPIEEKALDHIDSYLMLF
jgi:hypothetical protein